jgi:hypothetical protein
MMATVHAASLLLNHLETSRCLPDHSVSHAMVARSKASMLMSRLWPCLCTYIDRYVCDIDMPTKCTVTFLRDTLTHRVARALLPLRPAVAAAAAAATPACPHQRNHCLA